MKKKIASLFIIIVLTTLYRVLFEKLIVTQLIKKFSAIMEPKIHHHVKKSPPLDPIPSQLNPVCIFTP